MVWLDACHIVAPGAYNPRRVSMLKKAKAAFGQNESDVAKGLSKSVLESSHQIWLAGLGAFAKAQEGGRQLFDTLVQQGEMLESKTRKAAAQTAGAAREAATSKAREMQAMVGGTWDKLEQVFEDRVARSLARLGVYSSSDVEKLTQRVNELSEAVNALLKAQGIKPKAPHSPTESMVKGAVRSATRTAAKNVSKATNTAANTVSTATRGAKKTVRTAAKLAKAALK
jgi:poly(hydroxyalkanoate) granule-associated protein